MDCSEALLDGLYSPVAALLMPQRLTACLSCTGAFLRPSGGTPYDSDRPDAATMPTLSGSRNAPRTFEIRPLCGMPSNVPLTMVLVVFLNTGELGGRVYMSLSC